MRLLLIFVCLLLAFAAPASAHQLDEYLQATTIRLTKDKVALQLRLTPGASVAARVMSEIDANGDGAVSTAEWRAYAESVRKDVVLTVDGRPAALRLVSSTFPTRDAVFAGLGDIDLGFEGPLPPAPGSHSLGLENRHEKALAVDLVNTLVPNDPSIRISGQTRSIDQSSYRLDFSTEGAVSAAELAKVSSTGLPVVTSFFGHGVRHILTGYDHLLFVAALVLGAANLWDLVKVVTAFTIAHSLTLTLATLGLVRVPDAVVEPVIAASIVFVAVQNLIAPPRAGGGARLAVAFAFGLFHGLGFAGGLLEVMHGLEGATVSLAILGFSLGVEAGNQLVLLPLYFALKAARSADQRGSLRDPVLSFVVRASSAAIALAGACYFGMALAAAG